MYDRAATCLLCWLMSGCICISHSVCWNQLCNPSDVLFILVLKNLNYIQHTYLTNISNFQAFVLAVSFALLFF